jgi:hypothetical protein
MFLKKLIALYKKSIAPYKKKSKKISFPEREFLSINDASIFLGNISLITLVAKTRKHKINTYKVGKRIFYMRSDLQKIKRG